MSFLTIYHRHILAAVHYNFNLQRETKKRNGDGEERIKISYPKFKNGEATVRDVRVQPNFGEQAWSLFHSSCFCFGGIVCHKNKSSQSNNPVFFISWAVSTDYVEEIFQTYLNASKSDLTEAAAKLREMTPAPMNTMVEKQPREEAVQKRIKRRSMEVKDVPPTTPGRWMWNTMKWSQKLIVCCFPVRYLKSVTIFFQFQSVSQVPDGSEKQNPSVNNASNQWKDIKMLSTVLRIGKKTNF